MLHIACCDEGWFLDEFNEKEALCRVARAGVGRQRAPGRQRLRKARPHQVILSALSR